MPDNDSFTVKVNGREWKKVASLDSSTARDVHFTLDATTGRVAFGDGVTGKRPPKGARIEVSYRAGTGGAVAFRNQALCGVFRGLVINNIDPQARLRLLVQVPDAEITSAWAAACTSVGGSTLPKVGAVVWIAFENGNADYPVWLGVAFQ